MMGQLVFITSITQKAIVYWSVILDISGKMTQILAIHAREGAHNVTLPKAIVFLASLTTAMIILR